MNGSAHEISNRVYFSVKSSTVSSRYLSTGEPITIYPSPTDGLLHFDFNDFKENMIRISATTLSGKMVYTQNFNENQLKRTGSINLSGNKKGIYLIRMITNKSSITRKIIIN